MVRLVFFCPKKYIKVPIHHVRPKQEACFSVPYTIKIHWLILYEIYHEIISNLLIKNDPPEHKYCAFDIFVSSDFHSTPISYALSFYL